MEMVTLVPAALLSVIAFWRKEPVVFIWAGVAATFAGFYWYDEYTTSRGLAEALALLLFGFSCWGFAYIYMFMRDRDGR